MDRRQQSLDVVRGIAILSVLLFHFSAPTGSVVLDALLAPFAAAGWAGVDLFFVLSGYLVGGMILAEVARDGTLDRRRFFMRRASRLWPVLWAYLALLAASGAAWSMIWPVLFHVQNYAADLDVPSHLWSLAVEEHFYVLAALVLPGLARRGERALTATLVALILGVSALRIGALAAGVSFIDVQWQTQFRIDALAVGVLLAVWRRNRSAIFAWAASHRRWLVAGAAIGFAWLAAGAEDAIRYGIGRSVAWAASAALVLAAAEAAVAPAWRRPAAAMAWLGTISYSLYVWHASAGQVAEALVRSAGFGDGAELVAAKLALTVVTGTLVYRWVERPVLALRDRKGLRARWTKRTAILS